MTSSPSLRPATPLHGLSLLAGALPLLGGGCGRAEVAPPAAGAAEEALEEPVPASAEEPGQAWAAYHRLTNPVALERLGALEAQLAEGRDDARLHYDLGATLHKLGRHPEARAHLDRAIEKKPDMHLAWYQRGRLSYDQERYEDALADFDQTLALRPGFALAHLERGRTLLQLQRAEEAEAAFLRAREIRPKYAQAAFELALLRLDEEPAEAEALLREALGANPYHLGAAMNLARLLRREGRAEEAAAWLETHRRLSLLDDLGVLGEPESLRRYVLEARYYLANGRRAEARAALAAGQERFPGAADLAELASELEAAEGGR